MQKLVFYTEDNPIQDLFKICIDDSTLYIVCVWKKRSFLACPSMFPISYSV